LLQARIIPLRQEQLKERLGDRFRELDTPLLVEWPDGRRAGLLFVIEEETRSSSFSIYRLARYCLDMAELMGTDRVIPVVIFLRPGDPQTTLRLGGAVAYLEFRYLVCDLGRLPAKKYYDSANIVARLNLPNMAYSPEDRLAMYRAAQSGLARLEQNPEKQRKYFDFIDFYADLNEDEVSVYRMRYWVGKGEETMGLVSVLKEEGRQEGFQQGIQQGVQQGVQQGIQQGIQQGVQQGLREGIEALLEIKFGDRGLKLVPEIGKILDTERLRRIKEAIKVSGEIQDVEDVIWH
jgi:hypothetical protein